MPKANKRHLVALILLLSSSACQKSPSQSATEQFFLAVQKGDSLKTIALVNENPFQFRQTFHGIAKQAVHQTSLGNTDSAAVAWEQAAAIAGIFDNQRHDPFLATRLRYLSRLKGDSLRQKIRADSLYDAAQTLLSQGEYQQAEQRYDESAKICQSIGDTKLLLDNLLKLQYFHYYHGRQKNAIELATRVIKESGAIGYRYREAWGHFQLATTLFDLGQYREALPHLEEALQIGKQLGDRRAIRSTLERLGVAELRLGDYPRALQVYQESMQLSIEENDRNNVLRLHNGLARVHRLMGNYQEAKRHYLIALQISGELNDPNIATVLENLGNLYRILGDFATAEDYTKQALAHNRRIGNPLSIALNLITLGDVYKDREDFPAALEAYQGALTLLSGQHKEEQPRRLESELWISLGDVYLRSGDTRPAMQALQTAAQLTEQIGFRQGFVQAQIQLGRAYRNNEQPERAETFLQNGIRQATALRDPLLRFQGYYELGLLYTERLPSKAVQAFNQAIDIIDTTRTHLEDDDRVHYFATSAIQDCYDRLILLAAGQKDPARALWYTERSRARALLDVFQSRSDDKQGDHGSHSPVLQPSDIQARLSGDVQVLEYKITPEALIIFSYNREQLKMERVAVKREILERLVQDYRHVIGAGDFAGFNQRITQASQEVFRETAKLSARLYSLLIRPVEGQLNSDGTLYIIPDGSLNYLPFGALMPSQTRQEFLISRYRIAFAPSAAVLLHLLDQQAGASGAVAGRLLAVGDPALNLPHAKAEVRSIARLFSSADTLIGLQASEEAVVERLSGDRHYQVLHFATHAIINERKPNYSYLVLGVEAATKTPQLAVRSGSEHSLSDGSLITNEIAGLNLQGTELVSLSACKTATGKIFQGEGVVGLTRAFIQAGAPSLVTTLWDIDDEYTQRLMSAFYQNWLTAGMNKAEALRQAQLSIQQQMIDDPRLAYPHPNRWAAFMLTGDYR